MRSASECFAPYPHYSSRSVLAIPPFKLLDPPVSSWLNDVTSAASYNRGVPYSVTLQAICVVDGTGCGG